jgi:hypothetical protein
VIVPSAPFYSPVKCSSHGLIWGEFKALQVFGLAGIRNLFVLDLTLVDRPLVAEVHHNRHICLRIGNQFISDVVVDCFGVDGCSFEHLVSSVPEPFYSEC